MTAGLLELYETTFEPRFLRGALALAEHTERLFADPDGGWLMTSPAHETLIARERPAYDGAEPSGTSVALMNTARLTVLTDGAGDNPWRAVVRRALTAHASTLRERPVAMTEALLALDFVLDDPRQIALVWPDGQLTGELGTRVADLRRAVDSVFLPARVLAGGGEAAVAGLAGAVPFLAEKIARDGKPTAYVCRHGRCDLPDTDAAALSAKLRDPAPAA